MSHHLKTFSTALLLCCSPAMALASPGNYICKILQAVELSDDGRLVEHKGMWQVTIGKSFTVNRTTGEMTGHPFGTEGWLGGVQILNPGGKENGYKAMVLSGQPNVSAKYIYIAEYKEGPAKPFWGSGADQVIFSGTCF